MNKRRIIRAISGALAVAGVFTAIFGLVLCMCETPELAEQMKFMAKGIFLIITGSATAYFAGATRWTEGPYAKL